MDKIIINGDVQRLSRLPKPLEGGTLEIAIEKCNVPLQNITDIILKHPKKRIKVLVVLVEED